MLYLYNTLSRTIEEFKPLEDNLVKMYSCGPTVYDYQHIGHMRRYVGDDILVRVLEANGYTVTHVMNITDVGHLVSDSDTGEDKMEKGARKFGMSVWEIAKKFEEQFFYSADKLNIQRPNLVMHATEYIKDQIELIEILKEKGFTYEISDGIYFDTSKLSDYGKLTGQSLDELKAGARVEMVKGKRNPTDFALWKFDSAPNGLPRRQMSWWFEGPFSGQLYQKEQWHELDKMKHDKTISDKEWKQARFTMGFPGWHIECSAMSMKALGSQLDIHTGGIDHIPIHHTNEIAQSEAASGIQFVRYWVHHAFLLVDSEKMSKSRGNIYTVDDVIKKGFSPMALRYLYLQTHYRHEMNFTWKALSAAQTALDKLYEIASEFPQPRIGCAEFEQNFLDAINNDLNMPKAISIMWELLRSDYPNRAKAETLYKMDEVLGLNIKHVSQNLTVIPAEIQELVEKRAQLRKQKRFGQADQMRAQIEKKGYVVKDTEKGTKVIRKT